jgi:translocation and assembly module TamB
MGSLLLDRTILLSAVRHVGKILRRALAALALLALVALAALYAFTLTDRFREFARRELVESIRGSFRGQIGVERLEGSMWGDLQLANVSLEFGGTEVVRIPVVRLRYEILPLLHGELRFTDVEVDHPVVDLRRDEQGSWNVETALSTPPGSAGSSTVAVPNVVIEALLVTEGKISVSPCRAQTTCLLDEVALGARLEAEPTGVDADVQRLSLRLAAEGLPLFWADGSLRYQGTEAPPWLEIRQLAVVTQQSRGTLRGKIENLVGFRTAKTDLALTIEGLAPGDVSAVAPQSAASEWLGGSIRLFGSADDLHAHIELTAGQGSVQGDVHADSLATPIAADGAIEVRDLDLARVASRAEVGGLASGRLEATVHGTDVLQAKANANLQIRESSFRQWRFGDLTSTVSLADGRATTTGTLRAASGAARWNGAAELAGPQQFQLAANLTHLDPKGFDSRAESGDVNLEARVEGRGFALAQQQSHAIVDLASSTIGALVIDRGRADLTLADGRVHIAELSLASHDSQVRAAGDVALSTAASAQATVQAKIADAGPFLALAGIEGGGILTLDGTLRGALNDLGAAGSLTAVSFGIPRAWVERGALRFDLKGIGGQAPAGRLEADLGGVHSTVGLESLSAQVALSRAANALKADAALQAKDLGGRRYTTSFRATRDAGGIDVQVAALHLDAPRGNFDLEHPAHLALRSGVLTVDEMRISGSRAALTASGRVSHSGPQRFDVTVHGVPLEWIRSFRPGAGELGGNVDVKLDVKGTAASPEVDATISVADLRVSGHPYAGLRATVAYRAPAATLEARFDQDASHALVATGRAPVDLRWDPDLVYRLAGDIDLAVRSSGLDLAFVNALTPGTLRNVTGEIVMDLESHGPLDQPAPRGTIAFRNGGATILPLGVDVSAATVAVAVAPDAIRVTDLSAVSRNGHLSGSGTISMTGYAPDRLDLRIALDRWPAVATNRYRSDISAEIFCRGTVGAPQVTGTVDVLWGLFRPDLRFLTKAPTKRDPTIRIISAGTPPPGTPPTAPPSASSEAEPSTLYKNSTLDVTLTVQRNTWISHANASVELQGRVVARKQPESDLQLTGRIETVRGWMNFQGRQFQLSQGVIAFTGGRQIDPSLDVTADYKTGEYVVHVIIGGTADAPSLKLTSEPSLAQADILSLLMFGKTAKDLNEGQRVDVQNGAAQLAASFAAREVGQSVSEALGLSGRGIQLQELSASRVALGRYLTDKTFVTVGQKYGTQQGQEMRVEYELAPRWSITSSADAAGGSGADIIWHRRY